MNNRTLILVAILLLYSEGFAQPKKDYVVLPTSQKDISDLVLFNGGKRLVVADGADVKVFSTETYDLIKEYQGGHHDKIIAVDVAENESYMTTGGADSIFTVWDLEKARITDQQNPGVGIVASLDISPDNAIIAIGGSSGRMVLYENKSKKIVSAFTNHTADVTAVAFSPDGKFLVSGSGDNAINIYDVDKRELLHSASGHKSWVRDVTFNKDGGKVYSCGDDGRLIGWNVRNGHLSIFSKEKLSMSWLLSLEVRDDDYTKVYGALSGKVEIATRFNTYVANIRNPINKVIFMNPPESVLVIALATRGKGAILMNAYTMKFRN